MSLRGATVTALDQRGDADLSARVIEIQKPSDREYVTALINRNRERIGDAWKWYERLGEVHFGVSRSARIAGYARYVPRRYSDPEKSPHPEAIRLAKQLYSPFGGARSLFQRYYSCMKVPGECYLIQLRDANKNPDGLHFASASELVIDPTKPRSKVKWITMPEVEADAALGVQTKPGMTTTLDWDQFLGRVWLPGQEYIDLPDTPMLALQGDCEVLEDLNRTIRNRIRSRLAMEGILFIPSQLTLARNPYGDTEAKGKAASNRTTQSKLLDAVIKSMQVNYDRAKRGLEAAPIIISGPGEHGEQIRHFTLDLAIWDTDLQLRGDLIERILQGLDVHKKATQGADEKTSHWGVWAVSDEERRVTVQPDMETAAWVFQRLWMIPQMQKASPKIPEDVIADHYLELDLSRASIRSNMQEDARQAGDRGWIGAKAGRRMSGIEETDKPDEQEYIRWVGKQTGSPYLATWGMKAHGDSDDPSAKIDWDKVAASGTSRRGPSPESPADEPESGPGKGDPGSPNDRDSDEPRSERGG